jgi:hypothetical protein
MNTRHLAAGLLAATAFAASAGSANATAMSQPMPEPSGTAAVQAASAVRDSLMKELLAEYATSHRRSVHNEIILAGNVPASVAF